MRKRQRPKKFVFELKSLPSLYELDKAGSIRNGFTFDSLDSRTKIPGDIVSTPTEIQRAEFSRLLIDIGAGTRKKVYDEPERLGGCYWKFVSKNSAIAIKNEGLNSYSDSFDKLEAVIAKLLDLDVTKFS